MTEATPAAALEAMLARLAELKAEEAKMAPIKQEIEQLRITIQTTMQNVGSKRTEAVAGLFAVREERKTLTINDPVALSSWLEDNVMDVMAYYKLDPGAIKVLAAERLDQDGELLPGVDEVATEVISIRTAK